jgi:hypothetical protein
MTLLIFPLTKAYYVGYAEYGMNKTNAQRILNELNITNPESSWGLGSIIFTNAICTARWGGGCNVASFEYKGNWTRIIIGDYQNTDYDIMRFYIYHELYHYKQYRDKRIVQNMNGFNESMEQEADDYASSMVWPSYSLTMNISNMINTTYLIGNFSYIRDLEPIGGKENAA